MEFVRIILILKPERLIRIQELQHTQLNQIQVLQLDQLIQVLHAKLQLILVQAIQGIPDQVHQAVAQGAARLTVVEAEAVHLIAVEVPLQAVLHIPVVEVEAVLAEAHGVLARVQAPAGANIIIINLITKIINLLTNN